MEITRFLPVLLAAALLLQACTSSNWVLQEETVSDTAEGELIRSSQFIDIRELPTPERPVITLDLYNREVHEYPERQISKRYVQQYRPRYSWMLLGLSGAALAFYLANSPAFDEDARTRAEKRTLNTAGAVIALASVLNMKGVGEPFDTGESRMLKNVGTTTITDTLRATASDTGQVRIAAWHNNTLLRSGLTATFNNGTLSFNLIDKLELSGFEIEDAGSIHLDLEHEDLLYTFTIPVDSFMERFVSVQEDNVPLRSGANDLATNIVTNIGIDSQFPLVSEVGDSWFRVLFGISPVYLSMNDASIVWRPGNIDVDDLVMTPEVSAFGDLQVERNIPASPRQNPDGLAVLIGNGGYGEALPGFGDSGRSLELMKSYLTGPMGYYPENVLVIEDATEADFLELFSQTDSTTLMNRQIIPDTTEVVVYYLGLAVNDRRDETEAYLLPVDYSLTNPSQRLISASYFFRALGRLQTRSTVVMMESDFMRLNVENQQQFALNPRGGTLLRELAAHVTRDNDRASVFFAANRTQQAGIFASLDGRTDNRHGIFTYYFCRALKDGRVSTGEIYNSLQRNMTFTSRRLFDRAQDPQMFGSPTLRLTPEEE